MERVPPDRGRRLAVERVTDERMPDRGEMSADLVTDRARSGGRDERALSRAAHDGEVRERGARGVAHDVPRMDARVDALLVLRVVRDRMLDASFVGEALGRANE